MVVVRRLYILLVSAISLQSVVWATIALLRNLLVSELSAPKSAIALQTAVIVVGLPLFLVHWLWAQRLANGNEEERVAALRRFYLVAIMAAFVGPVAANSFGLINAIMRQLLGAQRPSYFHDPVNSLGASIIYHGVTILILALFWAYQRHVFNEDIRQQENRETNAQALALRLHIFIFAALGLGMIVSAAAPLLRWLLAQLGNTVTYFTTNVLATELTRLLVGLGLWLVFWLWAQRLFANGADMERESALRKLYLYAAVFMGTVAVVTTATTILAGIFSRILRASTGGDIREPLSILVTMGAVWAYHAVILHQDARQSAEQPQQASIRRLYRYLVAGVGLLALLIGLGGVISILFFTLDGEPFIGNVRQTLAWFLAAIVAGLLVWLLPWRQIETGATNEGELGSAERQSLARKIYLYLFIFIATMTVLGTAVYIVSQLVELLIASRSTAHLLRDLGMALAYSLLAISLWLYHGTILRSDNRVSAQEQHARLSALQVAILSGDHPALMERLRKRLQQELPELPLHPILTTDSPPAAAAPDATSEVAFLAQANVILSPATFALANVQAELATAVARSPAHKLFVPVSQQDYLWLGMEQMDEAAITKQTVQVIRQIAAGESIHLARGLGLGAILASILGGFIALSFLLLLAALTLIN